MAQNEANPGSHADQPPDFEELRKQIAHARQQAQAHLGRGDASSWEEVSLGSVASMLARVEQALLDTKLAQTPPIKPVDTLPTGFASTSAPTSNSASGSTTTSSTQAPPPQSSALLLVPPATALSLYSEPAMPLERSVFFDLWRMWAFHARITTRNIPKLEGKFLDLYPIAMSIKSLGGEAEMNRNSNLWKQLAFRLRYIDDEGQNDERSKHVIEVLQKIQEEVFRPFEQYCIDWSRLSEAERKQRLGEWMEAWKRSKAKAPSPASEPEDTLSTIAPAPRGLLFPPAALEHNPILNIAEHPEDAGVKLVEFYFQHFYPGVPLYTKIDRLLKMPPTEATRHGWTRERLDWLLKFQRHHAGRDPVQVVASIAKSLPALMSQRSQASVGSLELPMAPVHKPADSGKPIVQSPPTKYTLFPTQLVFRANGFIEATISKIEDLREYFESFASI
jgi:hypothetical protein